MELSLASDWLATNYFTPRIVSQKGTEQTTEFSYTSDRVLCAPAFGVVFNLTSLFAGCQLSLGERMHRQEYLHIGWPIYVFLRS